MDLADHVRQISSLVEEEVIYLFPAGNFKSNNLRMSKSNSVLKETKQ